jgi:hypothetical protein
MPHFQEEVEATSLSTFFGSLIPQKVKFIANCVSHGAAGRTRLTPQFKAKTTSRLWIVWLRFIFVCTHFSSSSSSSSSSSQSFHSYE